MGMEYRRLAERLPEMADAVFQYVVGVMDIPRIPVSLLTYYQVTQSYAALYSTVQIRDLLCSFINSLHIF